MTSKTKLTTLFLCSVVCILTSASVSSGQITTSENSKPFVERPHGTTYKVLVSADAAGFRGIIAAYVLIEFEDLIKRHILLHRSELLPEGHQIETIDDFEVSLADFVDCFSGSSTGAWTALYLASKGGNGVSANIFNEKRFIERYGVITPGSARGLLVLYNDFTNGVFPQDEVSPFFTNTDPDPTDPGVLTPFIPVSEAQSVFNGFYGSMTMSELSTSCMITGFDLISRSHLLFVHDKFATPAKTGFTRLVRRSTPRTRNMTFMSDIQGNYGVDYFIADIAIVSSAAMGFVPAHEILPAKGEAERMVAADGALYRPDPTLLVFSQVMNSTGASSYSDIAMLSITGGIVLQNLSSSANGGAAQWDAGFQREFFNLITMPEIFNRQFELFFYADPAVKAGQYLRIELYGHPGTELHRIVSGGFLSTDLPELSTLGQQVAASYRSSIESFVENFIFG